MDVTNELRLGGFFEPGLHLNGPTPRNLVLPHAGQLVPPPLPVQAGALVIPRNTRRSQNAQNPGHWMTGG
jgi:hypothetical protein